LKNTAPKKAQRITTRSIFCEEDVAMGTETDSREGLYFMTVQERKKESIRSA